MDTVMPEIADKRRSLVIKYPDCRGRALAHAAVVGDERDTSETHATVGCDAISRERDFGGILITVPWLPQFTILWFDLSKLSVVNTGASLLPRRTLIPFRVAFRSHQVSPEGRARPKEETSR
jgi:hypothetical protein